MNNKFKRIISILIMAAILLSVTACNGGGNGNGDDGTRQRQTNDEADAAVQAQAQILKTHESLPDIEVTEKIKLMSWYDLDETSPTAEIFKAKYGIPGEGIPEPGEKDVGNIFDIIRVPYDERYPQLNSRIAAGDSPDMFQFEERNFPWGVRANNYEAIDDLFDFSGSEWDATRDVMDLFKWQGKTYCAVTEISNSSALLYYKKTTAQEAGLDDPYDLWLQNRWNWDTFFEMCTEFSDPANNKYAIVGFYIDEAAILSTGTPIVGIENGQLKHNMDNIKIERAMDLLRRLATNNLRYPYHEISGFQIMPGPWRNGEVLFWGDGPWRNQEEIKVMRNADKWPEDEVNIVPFPKDPDADKYYHRGKQDALMLVAGAQNKDGFVAWTQCSVLAAQDKEMDWANRNKIMNQHGWTDLQLDTLQKIRDELTLVWDFKNGIGEDVSGATFNSPVENLSKRVVVFGDSYPQMRGENRGVIEPRIIAINTGGDVETYEIPECECDPNAVEEEFCEVCGSTEQLERTTIEDE